MNAAGAQHQQLRLYIQAMQRDLQHLHEQLSQSKADNEKLARSLSWETSNTARLNTLLQENAGQYAEDIARETGANDRLALLITSLTCMEAKDVYLVMKNEVDILQTLEKCETQGPQSSVGGTEYYQTAFTLQCYRDLNLKLTTANAQLVQAIEEKDAVIARLQEDSSSTDFEEGSATEIAVIGRVTQASPPRPIQV